MGEGELCPCSPRSLKNKTGFWWWRWRQRTACGGKRPYCQRIFQLRAGLSTLKTGGLGSREGLQCLWGLCCQWLRPVMHSKEQTLQLLALEQFLAILSWEPQGQPPGQWRGGGSCTGGTGHFLGRDGTFTTSTRLPMHHQLQPFDPQFKCGSWEQHCSKPMDWGQGVQLTSGTCCKKAPRVTQADSRGASSWAWRWPRIFQYLSPASGNLPEGRPSSFPAHEKSFKQERQKLWRWQKWPNLQARLKALWGRITSCPLYSPWHLWTLRDSGWFVDWPLYMAMDTAVEPSEFEVQGSHGCRCVYLRRWSLHVDRSLPGHTRGSWSLPPHIRPPARQASPISPDIHNMADFSSPLPQSQPESCC